MLDLPYSGWRHGQREAIEAIAESKKRIIILEAPPGTGKSGIAIGAARLMGARRSVVLCSTLQLMDQYLATAPDLKTVRGRANFDCMVQPTTADDAPCTVTGPGPCAYSSVCPYYVQRRSEEH